MGNGNIKTTNNKSQIKTLIWDKKSLKLIDQRKLPFKEEYVSCQTYKDVASAIKKMVIRGAPAIGVTAGYGVVLSAISFKGKDNSKFISYIKNSIKVIASARPTAVNLFWALNRMEKIIDSPEHKNIENIRLKLIEEAEKIERDDIETNYRIGENGKNIFKENKKIKILTHCNAGALATSGYGTAMGVIRSLARDGKIDFVLVCETRPYLQGSRLTSWELYQEGISCFVITDNMAGYFMSKKDVDAVIVGADRIALNGDSANKIGTLSLSILARYYSIPFYIAAPLSSVDAKIKSGDDIPIEQRGEEEVRMVMGKKIIPDYIKVKNPAFDVTPSCNITAIITEEAVVYPPFKLNMAKAINKKEKAELI